MCYNPLPNPPNPYHICLKKIHGLSELPGAHREKDVIDDDEGHGAAILSLKSHVKLKPLELSYTTSAGKLLSRHPARFINPTSIYMS